MNFKTFPAWKISVIVLYAAFVAVGLYHHEIWRDEAQALLIARDSPSLGAMLWQLHYEGGQPPTWYLILYAITHLGGGVVTMQVVHGIIAVVLAAVLLRFDLPKNVSILLLCGYFFFYEYAIISRPYSLSLIFLFLAAYELRHGRRDWKCGLWLGLASLTTIHAMILVVCLLPWIIHYDNTGKGKSNLFGFFLIVGACLANALICLIPAPDEYVNAINRLSLDAPISWILQTSEKALNNAFILLPSSQWPQKWKGYGVISNGSCGWLFYILAIVLVVRFGGKRAGGIFLTGSLALLMVFVFKYSGGARHHGYVWVWMLFSLLIVRDSFKKIFQSPVSGGIFLTLLLLQIPLGISMWGSDFNHPFSNAKAIADWLVKEKGQIGANEVPFGGRPGLILSPVVAYSGGKFFNIEGTRVETFVHNDLRYTTAISPQCPSDPSLPDLWIYGMRGAPGCNGFLELAGFTGAMLATENYSIFQRPHDMIDSQD